MSFQIREPLDSGTFKLRVKAERRISPYDGPFERWISGIWVTDDRIKAEGKLVDIYDGLTCTDVDECSENLHNCDSTKKCENTPGSFTCKCPSGVADDGVTCLKVDECATNQHNCDPNATCYDRKVGFDCSCNRHFSGTSEFRP